MVGIVLAISVGVVAAVLVFGGMYQQELFEDYMEGVENPPRSEKNPNLPSYDNLP